MQLKYLKRACSDNERACSDNEVKKPVLWNCVLQVQLYISLRDNIFEAFLKKQNHSLVPLIFCAINQKRWYNFSTRHFRETLLEGNTKEDEKYRYFSCIKKRGI